MAPIAKDKHTDHPFENLYENCGKRKKIFKNLWVGNKQ